MWLIVAPFFQADTELARLVRDYAKTHRQHIAGNDSDGFLLLVSDCPPGSFYQILPISQCLPPPFTSWRYFSAIRTAREDSSRVLVSLPESSDSSWLSPVWLFRSTCWGLRLWLIVTTGGRCDAVNSRIPCMLQMQIVSFLPYAFWSVCRFNPQMFKVEIWRRSSFSFISVSENAIIPLGWDILQDHSGGVRDFAKSFRRSGRFCKIIPGGVGDFAKSFQWGG